MSIDPDTLAKQPPLVQRLARETAATWVDEATIAPWLARGGDRVVLLAGDPVRFPEGQDVAVVLPELLKAFPGRLQVGVVAREHEDALARRYGSQRWPSLLFFRDGQYVTALTGMHDWDVYLQRVQEALEMPPSRAPTIGIPVVNGNTAPASDCH